ncbi:putative vivid protein [Podospora didyma]|uniref:Vivid protein n=1 Tax=Podospora didyma TaxID=330526 RepID=A0AAE0NH68_9PEZI|nr:putative vivid protein [Podospora didyma]
MNDWERIPYQNVGTQPAAEVYDPQGLIYPGLYAPSDYDMLKILADIHARPNPQVELGPIDASCALIMCDLRQPDQPIVYASPSFLYLTGYTLAEVLGKNCRFLQAPGGKVKPKSTRKYVDKDTVKRMRKAVEKNTELQIEVVNFKKNGEQFNNFLTMIPVCVSSDTFDHCVGFQCAV